jgi:ADP-heptose:LPS heptosyltransferase
MVRRKISKPTSCSRILVIKLGALGDFIQAMGPFEAIRKFYKESHIVLLTTKAFRSLGIQSGFFDQIWLDNRPNFWQVNNILKLRKRIVSFKFERVFDLQTSDRSNFYFHFIWPSEKPEWSGIARGCSHRHKNPKRDLMHTLDRQAEQLSLLGIDKVPSPNLGRTRKNKSKFKIQGKYFIIFHGGSRHRPRKRWPGKKYIELANYFFRYKKLRPIFLGDKEDRFSLKGLEKTCPGGLNLCGQTSLQQAVVLLRKAKFVIGNDTGPMHISAVLGRHSVVLFSKESDPRLCAPRGKNVRILQSNDLDQLSLKRVISAVNLLKMN